MMAKRRSKRRTTNPIQTKGIFRKNTTYMEARKVNITPGGKYSVNPYLGPAVKREGLTGKEVLRRSGKDYRRVSTHTRKIPRTQEAQVRRYRKLKPDYDFVEKKYIGRTASEQLAKIKSEGRKGFIKKQAFVMMGDSTYTGTVIPQFSVYRENGDL
tara:strand:- start:3541 stop:4008 length:468 start_codon:yes stop_codon:yes gene_type:complete